MNLLGCHPYGLVCYSAADGLVRSNQWSGIIEKTATKARMIEEKPLAKIYFCILVSW